MINAMGEGYLAIDKKYQTNVSPNQTPYIIKNILDHGVKSRIEFDKKGYNFTDQMYDYFTNGIDFFINSRVNMAKELMDRGLTVADIREPSNDNNIELLLGGMFHSLSKTSFDKYPAIILDDNGISIHSQLEMLKDTSTRKAINKMLEYPNSAMELKKITGIPLNQQLADIEEYKQGEYCSSSYYWPLEHMTAKSREKDAKQEFYDMHEKYSFNDRDEQKDKKYQKMLDKKLEQKDKQETTKASGGWVERHKKEAPVPSGHFM